MVNQYANLDQNIMLDNEQLDNSEQFRSEQKSSLLERLDFTLLMVLCPPWSPASGTPVGDSEQLHSEHL